MNEPRERGPRVSRYDVDNIVGRLTNMERRQIKMDATLDRIATVLGLEDPGKWGAKTLDDGRTFLPGTGTLNQDSDRKRSPEVQRAIEADKERHDDNTDTKMTPALRKILELKERAKQ